MHRDISPQNIMLRDDGVTKVVDFGIASTSNRSTRTATGTLKGKIAYMAPEQIHMRPTTALVDEYALGVVFWELLVGRRLFKAENDVELIKQVLGAPIERADVLMPDVPKALADIVEQMVHRDPQARFRSLGEVAEALEGQLVATTPALSPAAFMRRLGTDDLRVQQVRAATGDNYVISLNAATSVIEEPVDLKTHTGTLPPPPVKAAAPRRTVALLGVGVVSLIVAVVLVARGFSGEPPRPVEAAVEAAPTVAATPIVSAPAAPVVPQQTEGSLEIVTNPAGAQVRLDGRQLGRSPVRVSVEAEVKHYIQAEQSGFERSEGEVTLASAESRTFTLSLKPRKPSGGTRPVAAPAVTAEPGFLTISTEPWTKVSVDGEPIGSTPINKKRLSPGPHQLLLVNEGANINAKKSVLITSGENTKLRLTLP